MKISSKNLSTMALFGMVFCAGSVVLLISSDMSINMAASGIVGTNSESRFSAKVVAAGITVALVALGCFSVIVKSEIAQYGIWIVVLIASAFSAALTVQAVSVDYAMNDRGGSTFKKRQKNNSKMIKSWEDQREGLQELWDDCVKYERYGNCTRNNVQNRITLLNSKIESALEDNELSEQSKEVDITDAIEEKSGLDGAVIEKVLIFSRAICVPLMISILTNGFWRFFELYRKQTRNKGANTLNNPDKTVLDGDCRTDSVLNGSGGRKTDHAKRTRVRTLICEYQSQNAKMPSYTTAQKLYKDRYKEGVGKDIISEVMKQLKAA